MAPRHSRLGLFLAVGLSCLGLCAAEGLHEGLDGLDEGLGLPESAEDREMLLAAASTLQEKREVQHGGGAVSYSNTYHQPLNHQHQPLQLQPLQYEHQAQPVTGVGNAEESYAEYSPQAHAPVIPVQEQQVQHHVAQPVVQQIEHHVPTKHVEHVKQVPVNVVKVVNIPVPQPVPVPVPQPVAVPVPQPVPIHVPVPQPVAVPVLRAVHVEVEKPYPVQVDRHVPVHVDKPYPVHVAKHVAVPVPKPYPVHYPVYKHIYHHKTVKHH